MMNKQKIMKWALCALLMSAMTFELMPGSVGYFVKDMVSIPEGSAHNFFTPPVQGTAGSCLILCGVVTFVAMVMAIVAVCLKKNGLYRTIGMCSLGAGALAAAPYLTNTADVFVQPNVVVLLLLLACWLIAMSLDKKKDAEEGKKPQGKRL
jgi:uncharacterized membrane protein